MSTSSLRPDFGSTTSAAVRGLWQQEQEQGCGHRWASQQLLLMQC